VGMNVVHPVGALGALAAAKAAGIEVSLDGDRLLLEAADLPEDVVDLLTANKPDLMRILAGREAATVASNAKPPSDCSPPRWSAAQYGLKRFVERGYADRATLLGWTPEELYHVPPVWNRVDLTGAALMIDDRKVVAVTESSIAIETRSGAQLKFRRIGREHLAG
jgi:hypothetical protein